MRTRHLLGSLALVALAAPAFADEEAHKTCAEAFEKAQYLRKDGKLVDARAQAMVCGRDVCPGFVRDECTKMLSEIDATQPTVLFDVRDASGADLVDVRVEIDGKLLVERLGGSSILVDPGEHTLRFVHGGRTIEQHVVARVTEKDRRIDVRFPAPAPTATNSIAAPTGHVRGPLWPGLLATGVGAATIGVSFALGASAKSTADNLRATCAPRCAHDDVDGVNRELVVSDVLFVTGVVVAAVGIGLVILRPGGHEERPTATMVVGPTVGGAAGSLRIDF